MAEIRNAAWTLSMQVDWVDAKSGVTDRKQKKNVKGEDHNN